MSVIRIAPALMALGLVLTACQPAPTGSSTKPAESKAAESAAKPDTKAAPAAEKAATKVDQCEAGKEFWRASTAPVRGGTLVRAGTLDGIDPTKPVGAG